MENMSPALWAGDMFSMKYRIEIYKKIYEVIIVSNSTFCEGGNYRNNLVESSVNLLIVVSKFSYTDKVTDQLLTDSSPTTIIELFGSSST